MFNKNLVKTLNVLSNITNSIILEYPVTYGLSENASMAFQVDVSKIDSSEFTKMCFNDNLKNFLNIFNLFSDEFVVKCFQNCVQITSSDTKQKAQFILSDEALMAKYKYANAKFFEKIENSPDVATFELSSTQLKQLRAASAVFKGNESISFTSLDSNLEITLTNNDKFTLTGNNFTLLFDGVTDKDFDLKFKNHEFNLIPLCNYKVQIKYSSKNDFYMALLSTEDIPGFKLIISSVV